MTDLAIDIEEFLRQAALLPVIDVRTPAEFAHAHIPGAFNLPLFTNEERSFIGTLYVKKGSDEAIARGLELIRPKLEEFAGTAHKIALNGEALMHCWRGGMRSSSMAWLLNTAGIRTRILTGGYKSFRRYTAYVFSKPLKLIVIGGRTGSGKTDILKELKARSRQVIDLEELAVHKGSVFGGIGMPCQPTTEQFENNLFSVISKLDPLKPVYIEDESLAIGKVFIPRAFYDQMSSSVFVHIEVSAEKRLQRLIRQYTNESDEMLISGLKRLEKRLGLENTVQAVEMVCTGDLKGAARIALKYYDKIYDHSMSMHKRKSVTQVIVRHESISDISEKIISIFT